MPGFHSHIHHEHVHGNEHSHTHGIIDPSITSTKKGIWAVKWSFTGLIVTALFQVVVVYFSGSVALLADTIHNFGDASTAIPLWIAFRFAQRKPTKTFGYGLGRIEDLAGIFIIMIILFSGIVAAYESINRIIHPVQIENLSAVVIASVIGFAGNEAVAIFRIKTGKEIGSIALVADGHHARIDGFTSLSVLVGAIGVWLGFPLADPVIGILISLIIFRIVWQSAKAVITRTLDGVEPEIIDEIEHTALHVNGVIKVTEIKARWIGHQLYAELNIAVSPELSVHDGHEIAKEVNHQLMHHISFLSKSMIHIDPIDEAGDRYHKILNHNHDGLPLHSHL